MERRRPQCNALRYLSWKERKIIALDLRKIHAAPTAEAAEGRVEGPVTTKHRHGPVTPTGSGTSWHDESRTMHLRRRKSEWPPSRLVLTQTDSQAR